jgi:hypothetical protein
MAEKFTLPTETIELPSQGKVYELTNPLSSGTIEMKYMTAREEDILTNVNLLKQGIAIEKMLQSLIKSPIKYDDLLLGDRNALLIAARILAYGSSYNFEYVDPETEMKEVITVDLQSLKNKEVDYSQYKNKNEFNYILPKSGKNIKWKFLTYKEDLDLVNKVIAKGKNETSMTDALKAQIIEIDGERNPERISLIVENMLALDSKALRTYIENSKPGIDTTIKYMSDISGEEVSIDLPLTAEFFWPTT